VGVSHRQAQRFASGEHSIPIMIAKLIRLAKRHRMTAKEIKRL
jgi:hypothetical protein